MAIQQLIAQLEEMNEQHLSMLELGERKKQAIIQDEVEELMRIVSQEQKFVEMIQTQELKRQDIVQIFLRDKGIKSKLQLTITELSRLVFNPDEKHQLLAAQAKLTKTLQALKTMNQLNQDLIQRSLRYIDYSINLLLPEEQDVVYQNPMKAQYGNTNRPSHLTFRA